MNLLGRKLKHKPIRAVNLIAHSHPKLPISEQYRQIRTNIQFASIDIEIKTIAVTSPEPADGKSTISANLAIVLAQQGKPVLLVDTDLRKPSVHYTFNQSNLNGLTNVITKQISLLDAITKTYIPNLDIVTSGPIPPNPSELLNSKKMEDLIDELRGMYEYVIFDTPPILAVTDSQIITKKCDGAVMVVASRKTHREDALKAKVLLEKTQSQLLGVVVNGVIPAKNRYYYE